MSRLVLLLRMLRRIFYGCCTFGASLLSLLLLVLVVIAVPAGSDDVTEAGKSAHWPLRMLRMLRMLLLLVVVPLLLLLLRRGRKEDCCCCRCVRPVSAAVAAATGPTATRPFHHEAGAGGPA